jgi:hypothetical protein
MSAPTADPTQINAQVTGSAPPPQGPGVTNAPGAPAPAETRQPFEVADDTDFDQTTAPPPFVLPSREPVAPPPAPVAPPKPRHHSVTVQLAKDFGYTQEQIDTFEPAVLDQVVYQLSRRERQQPAARREPTPPPAPAPEPEVDLTEYGLSKELLDPTTGLDPRLTEFFKNVVKENRKLKTHVEQQGQREAVREQQTLHQRIRSQIAKHPGLFGDGSLAAGTPEAARYDALMGYLNQLPRDRQHGPETDIPAAVAAIWPGAQAPAPAPEPERRLPAEQERSYEVNAAANARPRNPENGRFTAEEWNNGAAARPTHRDAPIEKGEGGALKTIQEKLRSRGFDTSINQPDEE